MNSRRPWILAIMGLIMLSMAIPHPGLSAHVQANAKEPLVTVMFFNTDLREALAELSMLAETNIVVDSNVTGSITLDLVDVPLEQALRMMLVAGGYVYRRLDGFYLVGLADPRNRVFTDLARTEVYRFRNISAQTARALLPSIFHAYVQFDTTSDMAVVMAPPELAARIIADLQAMDGVRPHVKVRALVTEVSAEVIKEWGIDSLSWEFASGQALLPNWTSILGLATGSVSLSTDVFGMIAAKIRALERDKKAKVHADPTVLVLEGRTADLFIGDRHNILVTGETAGTRVERVEAGSSLKVTPRVHSDQIELTVTQKVSRLTEDMTYGPTVRAAEFSSVVRLTHGQTAMVAGLTSRESSAQVSKTPILGDIPLIRLLFRRNNDRQAENEIIIFLTAEVVK